jgi:hypothetical protein
MLYETVYDFARDEYWAGFYLRCAAGMLVIAVLLWFGLSSNDNSGPNDLRLFGWFALASLAPGLALAWYDHSSYLQMLAQQRGLEDGPITKIQPVGRRGRSGLTVCVAAGCFSGSREVMYLDSALKIGCNVRITHVQKGAVFVALSFGIPSKIISIDLDKASCPTKKPAAPTEQPSG